MGSVALTHVSMRFGDGPPVLRDVSLAVRDGEFVVLVGPSGCGKSTTLRLIAGLEEPSEGTIAIDGASLAGVPPRDRDIAMVFQNYALYPHMTVAENLGFGLRMRAFPPREIAARVAEAAGLLGIGDLLGRRPKELSGGQRQRVALGRAIVRHPKVFLFDEPLSNLDAGLRAQMRAEISRLHARLGATMVYVTHDQVEAMSMGERIAVMHEGRVEQYDAPLAIYDAPANRFVAGFIGSPSMNFLEGTIERAEGCWFVERGGTVRLPLPEMWERRLGAADSGPVTVGIRPEHLRFAGAGHPVEATIDVVEPVGNEVFVHVLLPGTTPALVCRVGADERPAAGSRRTIVIDTARLHLFDARGAAL